MFDGVLDSITSRITDAAGGFLSGLAAYVYLGEWIIIGLAVLGASLVVQTFFPFAWVRATLGVILVGLWAFITGLIVMWRHERR